MAARLSYIELTERIVSARRAMAYEVANGTSRSLGEREGLRDVIVVDVYDPGVTERIRDFCRAHADELARAGAAVAAKPSGRMAHVGMARRLPDAPRRDYDGGELSLGMA